MLHLPAAEGHLATKGLPSREIRALQKLPHVHGCSQCIRETNLVGSANSLHQAPAC